MVMQSKSEELYQVTWIILNAVKHLQVGKIKLAQFLKGSKSKVVKPISDEMFYGGLIGYDMPTITGFIEQLENMDMIQRKIIQGYSRDYPVLELTQVGKLVSDERKQIPLQIVKEVKPITVGESEKYTCESIKKGKAISEIAQERNLALSTIYTHVFRLIVNDYLSSSDVISKETISKVTDASKKLSKQTVKEVKELLPDVSYEEIRCVLAGLQKETQK